MEWVTVSTEILSAIAWPLVAIVAMFKFATPLSELIRNMKRIEIERAKLTAEFGAGIEKRDDALPASNDTVMKQADVKEILGNVSGITGDDVERNLPHLYKALLRNGIDTRRQLQNLVRSGKIMNALELLYIEELGRPPDKPLDASAIATWGAFLFMHGLKRDIVSAVRMSIRSSPEYKKEHR